MTIVSSYIASTVIAPTTTLAAGTVYMAAKNIHNLGITIGHALYLAEVNTRMFFFGTATAPVSTFGLYRTSASYTGGATFQAMPFATPFDTSPALIDLRANDSGLTGPAPGVTLRFHLMGMPSQPALLGQDTRCFKETSLPFQWIPGESIVLAAVQPLVPGIRLAPELIFHELG